MKCCCNYITILLILCTGHDATIICNLGLGDWFYYFKSFLILIITMITLVLTNLITIKYWRFKPCFWFQALCKEPKVMFLLVLGDQFNYNPALLNLSLWFLPWLWLMVSNERSLFCQNSGEPTAFVFTAEDLAKRKNIYGKTTGVGNLRKAVETANP